MLQLRMGSSRRRTSASTAGQQEQIVTLTERELQIARHGTLTNSQIAKALNISEHTVKNHWHHIYTKLAAAGMIPSRYGQKRIQTLKALHELELLDLKQLPIEQRNDVW